MSNTSLSTETPLPLQQLVCSNCGHLLEKIDWDLVQSCPNRCQGSYPVTKDEYSKSTLMLSWWDREVVDIMCGDLECT